MKVEKFSSIYNEAYQFLKHIRSFCDEFELSRVDEYKRLQVKETVDVEPESVIIELEGLDVDTLAATSIWMFGTEDKDYSSLRRVGIDIKLIAHDTLTGRKYLYKASIIQTGQMVAYNSFASGLQFVGHKRYAFSQNGMFPVLEPPGTIPKKIENEAKFFVAVEIIGNKSENFEIRGAKENRLNLWEYANSDPLLSIGEVMSWYRERCGNNKTYIENLIQVPYFKETAANREGSHEDFLQLPLEVKRESREYRFVSKGVILMR